MLTGVGAARGKEPSEYIRNLYYDTLVYGTENLQHLIKEVGISQLMIGTDHDFGMTNRNAVAHLLSAEGLSDDDIESILNGTAKRCLRSITFNQIKLSVRIGLRECLRPIFEHELKVGLEVVSIESSRGFYLVDLLHGLEGKYVENPCSGF